MHIIKGKVFKYGDDINTDLIIQNSDLSNDPGQMGKYCLKNLDAAFASKVGKGDIIVAGYNFGCGSAKPAQLALLGAGIECVIARSFARIFFRNAINSGLLPIESEKIAEHINYGDRLEIDFDRGLCMNVTQDTEYKLPHYHELISRIIECGGIINMVKTYGIK